MGHAARLENVERTAAFAASLHVAYQEPGIHQRGNADLALLGVIAAGGQAVEEGGSFLRFQEIDQAGQHGRDVGGRAGGDEVGNWVHNHHGRLHLAHELLNGDKVHLEAPIGGTMGMELEQAAFEVAIEFDTDGPHVADDLRGRFLESEIKGLFATGAGCLRKAARETGFAAARRAGDQDGAAAIEAFAAEHVVEPLDAGGNAFAGRAMHESQ